MTISIFKFSDGRKSYSNGGISWKINGENPILEGELEVEDELGQKFMDNPDIYNIDLEKGIILK